MMGGVVAGVAPYSRGGYLVIEEEGLKEVAGPEVSTARFEGGGQKISFLSWKFLGKCERASACGLILSGPTFCLPRVKKYFQMYFFFSFLFRCSLVRVKLTKSSSSNFSHQS